MTVKLKNYEIVRAINALRSIKALETSDKANFAIGKNIRLLTGHANDLEEAQRKIAKDRFGDKMNVDTSAHPERSAFEDAMLSLNKVEVDCEIHQMSVTDFKKGEVPSGSVLADIWFLFTDW